MEFYLPSKNYPVKVSLCKNMVFLKTLFAKPFLLEMDGYIQKQQGRTSIVLEHNLSTPQLSEIKTVGELNRPLTHQVKTTLTSLYIVQGKKN